MVVVTDKEYYMDNALIVMCDKAIKRQKKGWDNLFIYDGDEGAGKSSMAIAHAYYLAEKTGVELDVTKHIHFDLDKLMEVASKTERQVFVWDEAALGGLSTQWSSKIQNKLIQALMVCRKKGHFWIFCIPKFYELRTYIVRRALGLVHIYSPDGEERGYFTYYRKDRKDEIYYNIKKTMLERPNYAKFSFRGKFINYQNKDIIDWKAYEDKKDKAILDTFGKGNDLTRKEEHLITLKYQIALFLREKGYKCKEVAGYFNKSPSTMSDWYNLPKVYPFLKENDNGR